MQRHRWLHWGRWGSSQALQAPWCQPADGGLQPNSNGLQPNGNGLQARSHGLQPTSNGRCQPGWQQSAQPHVSPVRLISADAEKAHSIGADMRMACASVCKWICCQLHVEQEREIMKLPGLKLCLHFRLQSVGRQSNQLTLSISTPPRIIPGLKLSLLFLPTLLAIYAQ